ncbi:F185A-like protein [Mya arenaria]|uniref:F185A-like protein n=1 Tax=Mya arenaria TaxID=6604 RepID=A0ABY7DMX5_MYAAR|nr:F185A-like protein [Mya arenaria]
MVQLSIVQLLVFRYLPRTVSCRRNLTAVKGACYVSTRKLRTFSAQRSIFKNQLRQEQIESEVPDLGTVLESWYFDVQKHGQLKVSSPMDVHIRPIDPQKYPEMNKLFINVLYMGNDKIRLSELQNLTKQYIVNLDVKEFNTDVSVSCTNTGEACVEQMEGQNVHVKTHKGDCLLKNIKGFNINVETKEGNIVGRKVLQGNLRLTSVDGSIAADRVQGQVVECAGRHGNIQVKDVYADKSHFHTHHGNICLGSCHGNTQVTLDIGDLTVGSLDGNLSVKVGRGDSVVAMSREGNINMETGTDNVCVNVFVGDVCLKDVCMRYWCECCLFVMSVRMLFVGDVCVKVVSAFQGDVCVKVKVVFAFVGDVCVKVVSAFVGDVCMKVVSAFVGDVSVKVKVVSAFVGDVCVKVAESQKGKVSLTGTSIDPGKVALNNMQIEKADNITSVTGTLANLDSGKKEVKVKTGKGRISLEYYSWLASLNIFKDASFRFLLLSVSGEWLKFRGALNSMRRGCGGGVCPPVHSFRFFVLVLIPPQNVQLFTECGDDAT